MKRILLSCLLLLSIHTLKAQDTRLNNVVNTLKERITLAGYAQVGYTYDDAGEKASNTFDLKRAIFMARGKITDKWSCYFMYSFANTGKILEAAPEEIPTSTPSSFAIYLEYSKESSLETGITSS